MFYPQKILLTLLSPISAILFLIFLGVYKKKWAFIFLATIALFLLSLPVTSYQLIKAIESGNQKVSPKIFDKNELIVVLSGYLSIVDTPQGKQFQWGVADRFFKGIELANLNKSSLLVFTNERLPWNTETPDIAMFLINNAELMGIERTRILITTPVQNTQDEAIAVAKLGAEKGFNSVILITSAFHMQRAALLFENAGMKVTPYPVDFRSDTHEYNILDFLPSASGLSGSEFAIRELIGRLYYRSIK